MNRSSKKQKAKREWIKKKYREPSEERKKKKHQWIFFSTKHFRFVHKQTAKRAVQTAQTDTQKFGGVTGRVRGHNHKIIRRRIKEKEYWIACVCMSHVTRYFDSPFTSDTKTITERMNLVFKKYKQPHHILISVRSIVTTDGRRFFFFHSIHNYPFIWCSTVYAI